MLVRVNLSVISVQCRTFPVRRKFDLHDVLGEWMPPRGIAKSCTPRFLTSAFSSWACCSVDPARRLRSFSTPSTFCLSLSFSTRSTFKFSSLFLFITSISFLISANRAIGSLWWFWWLPWFSIFLVVTIGSSG